MPKPKTKKVSEAQLIETLKSEVKALTGESIKTLSKFQDLPLSPNTKKGLHAAHFMQMTEVQRQSLLPALTGNDLLGAARTGSGKTLAFLIPVLERLFYENWTSMDGLGALIITPTRELACQIFEVLRKTGKYHTFSAGLLIGGKNVKEERDRVGRLNILVCTPGRLLQHMDQSPSFDATNLKVLVLDEADRILDMGFKATLDAIIESLGRERQTMLFSATQTKRVQDLARLSLVDPVYVSVDEVSPTATPEGLEQFYMLCELQNKLDTLWSFLRTHTKSKVLVFMSSSKQVRFVYESFRALQPGIPLLHLHGRQKQTSRFETTSKFARARSSCLFATDIVARGMDFPEVDWVVQLDCPEDTATYIHRVGRSARAGKAGNALLLLLPEEEAFLRDLEARKVPIVQLAVRETKKKTIQQDLQAQCFKRPEIKYLAQTAFVSYVRSVHLQSNKQVFNVEKLPLTEFAQSLGLSSAPSVKIKGSGTKNAAKNQPRLPDSEETTEKVKTRYERMFKRQNQDVFSEHYKRLHNNDKEDDDDELMTVKRRGHELDEDVIPALASAPESKRASKRALSKKQSLKGNPSKLVFDEEGKPHALYEFQDEEDFARDGSAEAQRQTFVEAESKDMDTKDIDDKALAKAKRQEKKRRRKELEQLSLQQDLESSEEEVQVRLPSPSSDEEPQQRKQKRHRAAPIEVNEPETLEDLEELSARLLRG